MSAVLEAAIAQDLEDLRTHGRMRAADELSLRTGQHFNATTLPLYFTGDLNAQLVLVHLNPKQGNDHAARCTGHVPALDEYMAHHASFGRRMYGQASGRTHRSPFDHKQVRFLRPFGLIDLLAEDAPDARFTNLERVIDHKLQMEVIPYGSDTFSTAGMTPQVLAPHLNRLLDTIAATDRAVILFCGVVLGQLLQPYVTKEHRFRLPKVDGQPTVNEARFANLMIEHAGRTLRAGLAYSYAQQGPPLDAYGVACATRYDGGTPPATPVSAELEPRAPRLPEPALTPVVTQPAEMSLSNGQTDLVGALRGINCHEALIDLIRDLPMSTPRAVLRPTEGNDESYNVLGGPDCEAAMYVDRTRLYIALDPADAHRVAALTGVAVAGKNPTTWRLRVSPADAARAAAVRHLRDAVSLSLTRSRERQAADRSRATSGNLAAPRPVCPACGIEMPRSGICDDHGRLQ